MTKSLKEQMLQAKFTLKEKQDQNSRPRKAKPLVPPLITAPVTSKPLREPCDTVHRGRSQLRRVYLSADGLRLHLGPTCRHGARGHASQLHGALPRPEPHRRSDKRRKHQEGVARQTLAERVLTLLARICR